MVSLKRLAVNDCTLVQEKNSRPNNSKSSHGAKTFWNFCQSGKNSNTQSIK